MDSSVSIRSTNFMPVFRAYSKSEEAYADAAFLCSMGLDASVVDERAFGGNLLGTSTEGIRVELSEEQLATATQLLETRDFDVSKTLPKETITPDHSTFTLGRWLRALLIFDLIGGALLLTLELACYTEPPPPVQQYLDSQAFSDALWRLAYISHWPLILCHVLASILCFSYSRFGRSLFTFTIIWSIVIQLGPPPQIYGPTLSFFGSLQWTAAIMALALMYWSPLHERFRR